MIGKWKLEWKEKGSLNWVIRKGNWNRKVGTARWDGGGKRSWKRGGCKGVEAGGEVQLKWEKELELRRDTMGVGEK